MEEREKIDEALLREGRLVMPFQGVSMLPMLRTCKDSVVVEPKKEKLRPLDVALYRRESTSSYVLHRVISIKEDGYIIRGDNCYSDEDIREEQVFGVLTGYFRGEKYIPVTDEKYLKYARRRVKNYKYRRIMHALKGKVRGLWKKLRNK